MRHLCLTIAYDGTDYVGWQVQPNGTSVQSHIERAIEKLTGTATRVMAAGRTDSGVHALGQTASFQTVSKIPTGKFLQGLQTFLPDDIVIRDVRETAPEFHATYSATRKQYRYVIYNGRILNPFVRRYCHHFHGPLDVAAMHDAAQRVVGTHDFRCFESHFPNKATSVRTVERAQVRRRTGWPTWHANSFSGDAANHWTDPAVEQEIVRMTRNGQTTSAGSAAGDFIWFDIEADGFLYNMVRAIAGTLIKIGRGFWTPQDMSRIINSQDRSQAGETAPPHGLYLVRVDYEENKPS